MQRIRRALGLTPAARSPSGADGERPELDREGVRRFESHLRRELERGLIERTGKLPPVAAAGRARPGAADEPDPGPGGRAPLGDPAQAPAGDPRARAARPQPRAAVDVRRTMRASLETGGVPLRLRYRPKRPRRPEIYVLCDVSTSVTSASVFFLSVLHALHDSFRKLRSFVFIERISEVTEAFERERDFRKISERISREGGVADVSGYTDYGRVWLEFLEEISADLDPRSTVIVLGDARTNGRDPHAAAFAQLTERAGPHLLAQPRAAPVLELRRLGDGRLRAPHDPRLRVLDDQAPRAVRRRRSPAARPATERRRDAHVRPPRGARGQAG